MAGKLNIENAKMLFRNFAGQEKMYNPEGKRNFCVILEDPEVINMLKKDGWNVKHRDPREEGEEELFYLPVEVSYKVKPPYIMVITGSASTLLDEESVSMLDYADIMTADLVINPYSWDVNGNKGVKAYLDRAYITLEEDPFAKKYSSGDDEVPF